MKYSFKILTYNIETPVKPPLRIYGQKERIKRLKPVLGRYVEKEEVDVILFNELIPREYETLVTDQMSDMGYIHRTETMSESVSVNGGIILFSKFPIIQQSLSTFGDQCSGDDCLAAKGVIFARVDKLGHAFNIFGTHMQAWPGVGNQMIRDNQIKQIFSFVKSRNIPIEEPVFLCGDLNMDLYHDNDHVKHLLYQLGFTIPEIRKGSHPFTVDPEENKLVGSDDPSRYKSPEYPEGCVKEYFETWKCPCCQPEWIDYTLFSQYHKQPTVSSMEVVKLKAPSFQVSMGLNIKVDIEDLSDHFPVLGRFEFEYEESEVAKKSRNVKVWSRCS